MLENGKYAIWTVNPDGSQQHKVAEEDSLLSPRWSPDGNQIAFASNEGGSNKVWIIDAVSGRPRQLARTKLSESCLVYWSPGNDILYHRLGNRNYFFLNPVTEEERSLVQDESVGWLSYLQMSHDGRKVAVYWNREPSGIWVISLANHSAQFLTKGSFIPIGWSQDQLSIYLMGNSDSSDNAIYALPASGGAPKIFLTMPDHLDWAIASPDGKKFVCRLGERQSDVWIVENFNPAQRK